MKLLHRETEIAVPPVATLLWDQDELLDVTSGQRIGVGGSVSPRKWFMGYEFDRVVGIRQGTTLWAVLYDNRGTKGVLMKNGVKHRELNRSYYCARDYDYPVALVVIPMGRAAVIHCPQEFDILSIDDAETGEILGTKKTRSMEFHSRLAVSQDGRYLLDAGWFWHPVGGAWVCAVAVLLGNSAESGDELDFSLGAEIDSAGFLDNQNVVVTSTDEIVDEEIPATGIGPLKLGVWSIADRRRSSIADLTEPCGTIMPWREWVISFHGCPKAIEIATGKVIHRWDHIHSGKQIGSINLGDPPPPPIALDPQNGRFAVSGPNGITIVTLGSE